MKKALLIIVVSGCLIFLSSCGPLVDMGKGEGPGIFDPEAEHKDFFLEEEGVPGTYIFKVNNPVYAGTYGYSFWVMKEPFETVFTGVGLELSKISGHVDGGYGLIFCQTQTDDGVVYLVLLINRSGEYCVGKIVHNRFFYLERWKKSENLISGPAMVNTIRVERTDLSEYKYYFNDQVTGIILDNGENIATGGGWGFVAVVSPLDKFPSTPVEVHFKVLD